jgi:ABC-type transporter Mla subunit MlaD
MWRAPYGRFDSGPRSRYNRRMAKKPESSRVPSAIGALPVVGDLMKSADQQARWMQELLEQNARLVGQFPATIKSFNDALERFNETVGRLDRAVTPIESATRQLTGPMERVAGAIDPKTLRDLPQVLESLRREAIPALKATTDTQKQVALVQSTIERVIGALSELPGAGVLRRIVAGREDGESSGRPKPT